MELRPEEIEELSRIMHDLRGATWVMRGFLELLVTNWDEYDEVRRRALVRQALDNGDRVKNALEQLDSWRGPARGAASGC